MSISGVQMDLRDVSYYIKRKQGFPSITDLGVLDIFLGGSGFSFKIKMATADKADRQHFFKVEKVDVDVKNFKIKVKQSKHKLLFSLAKPIMLKVIRPALQKVLEKQIKEAVHQLDGVCYQIKTEADRAQSEAQDDPENAPNVYRRYWNATQGHYTQRAQKKADKAKEKASDAKFNISMTAHDSIFPQIKLPGGISTKATEYKELAMKGNKWESPVFKIGSASPTKNLPRAEKITRKDHQVTEARLTERHEVQGRGGNNVPDAAGYAAAGGAVGGAAGYAAGSNANYNAPGANYNVPGTAGYAGGANNAPGAAGYAGGANNRAPGAAGFAGGADEMAPGAAGYAGGATGQAGRGNDYAPRGNDYAPGLPTQSGAGYGGGADNIAPGAPGHAGGATNLAPGTGGDPALAAATAAYGNKAEPFSNQVDQAFGNTNVNGHKGQLGQTNGHTMLGANNPVINGNAMHTV